MLNEKKLLREETRREEFIAFSRGLHVRMTNDTPVVVDSSLARVIFHSYRLSRSNVRVRTGLFRPIMCST